MLDLETKQRVLTLELGMKQESVNMSWKVIRLIIRKILAWKPYRDSGRESRQLLTVCNNRACLEDGRESLKNMLECTRIM